MAQDTLTLEVATPLGLVLKTEAQSVAAPSVHGEFGVLAGHLPLLAAVRPGLLKYKSGGKDHVAAVSAGFVEAGPAKVLLLTDQFVQGKNVDQDAVKRELAEAEKALAAYKERFEGAQYEELQRKVDWCNAQLEAHAADAR